jgi:hypothetical protein
MSGRSCSIAWPVFFPRDGVAREEPVQRRVRHRQTDAGERHAKFVERNVPVRLPQSQHLLAALLDPA